MLLKSERRWSVLLIIAIISFSLVFSACVSKRGQSADQPTAVPPTEAPTPTPVLPDRAVLIARADADPATVAETQALLTELTASSGLQFETRQDITAEQITSDVKIVIFLVQPDNLGSLAANAPKTSFAAIGNQNWNPPSNVIIIKKRDNDVSFLSGFIAAMLAPNFRVGALLTAENTEMNQAFQNGVGYYCGLCAAVLYPLNTYPVVSTQPGGSPAETWQAAFDQLNLSKINVLFLPREVISTQLLTYLSGFDVAIISNQEPLDEGRTRWAVSIYSDGISPIREIWNDLLSGSGGKVVSAGIKVNDSQAITLTDGSVWLSQGKLILVNKVIEQLRDDLISTLPVQ